METLQQPEYQEQIDLLERLLAPQPTVIGVEGGPCGGKTTLMERVKSDAATTGRQVHIIPEAATRHIAAYAERGIDIGHASKYDRSTFLDFEVDVLRTIHDEIRQARETYAGTDAVILVDRVDIHAYLSEQEHNEVLARLRLSGPPLLQQVDQLYYLPTLARSQPTKYERLKATNPQRYENADEAVATCQNNLAAVRRHPELHIGWSDGDDSFEQTIEHLARSILEPETEREIKLTETPPGGSIEAMVRRAEATDGTSEHELLSSNRIEQAYYRLNQHSFRLRRTKTERGETIHTLTVKTGDGVERHERQRILSESDFDLLARSPQVGSKLDKVRHSFLRSQGGRRRLLQADWYEDLLHWDLEADVTDAADAALVEASLTADGELARATHTAELLARKLGEQGLKGF